MQTKNHAINFGKAIVESALACCPALGLGVNVKENQKQIIKKYMVDFEVESSYDFFERVTKTNIDDILFEIIDLIRSISQRIIIADENDEPLDDYFFLSACINFADVTMFTITSIPDGGNLLKLMSYTLVESAIKTSEKLGVKHPYFTKSDYMESDTTVIQNKMKIWLSDIGIFLNYEKNYEKKAIDRWKNQGIMTSIFLVTVTVVNYIIDVRLKIK